MTLNKHAKFHRNQAIGASIEKEVKIIYLKYMYVQQCVRTFIRVRKMCHLKKVH